MLLLFFFFFQAEDGIRDYKVTGVQTCALPICALRRARLWPRDESRDRMAGARLEAGVRGVARPGGGRRALDGDARVGPDAGRGAPGLRGGAGPGPRYGFGRLCARATTRARSRSSVRIERDQESFASPW